MTDTGSFCFEKTSAITHQIVAQLIENGADPVRCYDEIYNQKTVQSLKLLGLALTRMDIYGNGKISIMSIRKSDFDEADAIEDDTEGFVRNTLSIRGVEVGVLITEREKGELRISFRSKGNYSIREVAAKFGGGGHKFASGARTLNQDFEDVKTRIVSELEKLFIL
jgi:phosphoesterase RecJ-like protein